MPKRNTEIKTDGGIEAGVVVGLKYIGAGAALPDVPARDLTLDEAKALPFELLKACYTSGLYVDQTEE